MSGARIVSLGCRLNIAESERMSAMLAGERDLVVINSCAVTSEAVRQTRQAIRKARRQSPDARLLVTGCAADIEREQLSAMAEVDGLIANQSKLDPRVWNSASQAKSAPIARQHTRAFIAVQNGCDHSCTFCVIPQGRGRSRSLPIESVLEHIAHAMDCGAPEVVLTGVDVTSWGHDLEGAPRLGTLVGQILKAFPKLERLRMSSLDGVEIDPELLEILVSEPRMMPHVHLSLQHGHDLILKRMKRRHLRRDAQKLVETLKAKRPEIAIGADLIAGFPTETEAHHAANFSLIEELDIVHGHIFPFSPRPSTPAARMPQLERPVIKRRAGELRAAIRAVHSRWLSSQIGKELSVLVESDSAGYAQNFARVRAPDGSAPGEIVPIVPERIEEGLLL